jgi:hypothetical protein
MTDTVTVTMTKEEVARQWAGREGLCLISWDTLTELVNLYNKSVPGRLLFDQAKCTYFLKSKQEAA